MKTAVKELLGAGRLLGDAALYGERYPFYAICASDEVKFLSLRVIDYFEKVIHRSPPLDRPATDSNPVAIASARAYASEVEDAERTKRAKKGRAWLRGRERSARTARDARAFQAREWKAVLAKEVLPKRLPPAARPHRSVAPTTGDVFQSVDLNYPRDIDLFPSVHRSVLAERSANSMTAIPKSRSPDSALESSSLSAWCKIESIELGRVEADYQLHTGLGLAVEDADGGRTQERESDVGSAVLFTCGGKLLQEREPSRSESDAARWLQPGRRRQP